ncbi:MAG: glycosyltransferase family 4 protein [Nocardioides sp.]
MPEAGSTRVWAEVGGSAPTTDRVHFLMFDATGYGGVARTVTRLAGHLAETHEVHLHSLLRNADDPPYPIDPRVTVTWMVDNRRGRRHRGRPRHDPWARPRWRRLDRLPSALEPEQGISAYTDLLLRRELPKLAPGVLVTTRPMLHLAAARWAPDRVLHIAQDHLNFELRMRNPTITAMLDQAVPTVDAFVTLTRADRRDYERRYPGTLIEQIPNASPFPLGARALLTDKIVVSAGRLTGRKGFDRLIQAWGPVAGRFPDWQLHIYGEGECRPGLEQQVHRLGLTDSVRLPGHTADIETALMNAGVYAMSSRVEGFPMVLLEAMTHGLPLVAFDCPRGPAEIIEDGVNGRLVDDHDVAGYSRALAELVADSERRRCMGAASYARARSFQIETVGEEWDNLFAEVLDRRLAGVE